MLKRVISGGQTGVDQAALRAAKTIGLETGGWMPHGWLTEDGSPPEFQELYGMRQQASPVYSARTRANIEMADATLIIVPSSSDHPGEGTQLTIDICTERQARHKVVHLWASQIEETADWIAANDLRSINVAGPRESTCPGIGVETELWLVEVFREMLGQRQVS